MPRDFSPPRELADVFVSLWAGYPEAAPERGVHFMHTYWRLKPGVRLSQAQAEINQADHRLAEEFPDTERERGTVLLPLRDRLVGNVRPALLVLFGAVGLVLLIACANFAMLLMARAVTRQRELMIRASLGAQNGRLIRQRLTESTLLALVGGAAGLIAAKAGTTLLLAFKPAELRRLDAIPMDARVFICLIAFPGVQAAMITDLPLAGNFVGHRVLIDRQPTRAVGSEPLVQTLSVMGNYFGVMQIPMRAGRDFSALDREGQPRVAIVNEAFARQLLPGQSPIGIRIDWARNETREWMTTIG